MRSSTGFVRFCDSATHGRSACHLHRRLWSSPERAAAVANALAATYVRWEIEARQQSAREAADWLEIRIAQQQEAVQRAEAAVTEFRLQHGLNVLGVAGATLNDQRGTDLNNQLAVLRADQVQLEAKLQRARASRNSPSGPSRNW